MRRLNRLELGGETPRAALDALAVAAPDWLRPIAPANWHKRCDRRVGDMRLPEAGSKRDTRWSGTMIHLTETCDAEMPRLVVHADTTPANQPCPSRARCTRARSKHQGRVLALLPRPGHEALAAARARENTAEGKRLYAQRH